jgi:hypothetical protein
MIGAVSTSRFRRCVAATVSAAVIAAQAPAQAQRTGSPAPERSDEERAAARAAATEGVQLLEQGRYVEALDRLQRAEALVHAPTHMLYIARAEVKLGRLVEASETYLRIRHEALPSDAPRAFVEAQAAAAQEGKDVDARMPTLLIRVGGAGAAGATVTLDGVALPPPMIGLAFPINPGTHGLRAVGRDGASAEGSARIAEGAHETALLVLRAPPQVAIGPAAPTTPEAPAPPAGGGGGIGRALGFGALGLGVAGAVVGTVFVATNRSKRTQANDLCPGGLCPLADKAQIQSLDQQADSAATAAWIAFGAGGAAAAVGIVLLLTSGSGKNKGASSRMLPWIGAGACGVSGEF